MKKIILTTFLAFSIFAYSQEKKDDQVRAFSAMRLQVFYPIQFGDHSLAKAHEASVGFGSSVNIVSYKSFNVGFGVDLQNYSVSNKQLVGNFGSSKYIGCYGFASYFVPVTSKFSVLPDFGYGTANIRQRSGKQKFGDQNGNEYRFGANVDYLLGKSFAVFCGIHYIHYDLDMKTAPEYVDFYGKANQVQVALGIKF